MLDEQHSNKTKLEFLPNELLFFIFDHLYCDEIIYAFNKLNHRFQTLLHTYAFYHFNHSNEISKLRFDFVEQFQLDIQHIKSLKLSKNVNLLGDNEQCLLSYSIELFYPKLQVLSLVDSDPSQTISLIYLLGNFQELRVLSMSHKDWSIYDGHIRNKICQVILFEIKTLKHFIWNVRQSFFDETSTITSSVKSSIEYYEFYSLQTNHIEWLNCHSFNLKSLRISYPNFFCASHEQQTFDGLVSLSLEYITVISDLAYLLRHLPDLIHLRKLVLQGQCWSGTELADGVIWKDLIEETIPCLKVFQFFFILNISLDSSKRDELIESFRTDFWLIEKKWFITCDYEASCGSSYFYSLPCIKSTLDYSHSRKQFSTRTRTIDDTAYIHQLNLYGIQSQQIESFHRLNYVQSLTLNSINNDVTYDQLNQIVNMSSVKHIDLRSIINYDLFCELFKYRHHEYVSLEIDYDQFKQILADIRVDHYQNFQNIKSLEVRRRKKSTFDTEDLKDLLHYFPNLEKLVLKRSIQTIDIRYLFDNFQFLSLLVVDCQNFSASDIDITHKRNIIWRKYNNTLWFLLQLVIS